MTRTGNGWRRKFPIYTPRSAHRLGLYTIKSELEDLSLKYTDRKQYDFIKQKLNETKRSRDAYIAEFITPIKSKLEEAGLQFDIKGTHEVHPLHQQQAEETEHPVRRHIRLVCHPHHPRHAV